MDASSRHKIANLRARAALLRERATQTLSQAFGDTYLDMAKDYENRAASIEAEDFSVSTKDSIS